MIYWRLISSGTLQSSWCTVDKRIFHKHAKLIGNIDISGFTTLKQKIQQQNVASMRSKCWIFLFSCSKISDANIAIIANFVKTSIGYVQGDTVAFPATGWGGGQETWIYATAFGGHHFVTIFTRWRGAWPPPPPSESATESKRTP